MNNKLVLTGVISKKWGCVLPDAEKINEIKKMFPGGIKILCRPTSNPELKIEASKIIPDVEISAGDFDDKNFMEGALFEADTVLHVAGIYNTEKILEAALKNNVRRLILVHTTGIYSKYKSAGENYRKIDELVTKKCHENNIVLTILRPTMIYGNIKDNNISVFIKMVDKFPLMPVVSGGNFNLQPVLYKDLTKAYFEVLTHENETANKNYILSGGEIISFRDLLTVIAENLGKQIKFVSIPFFMAYSLAWVLYLMTFGKKDYREKVQRLCEPRAYPHDEAKNDFGYSPVKFREGIVDEVKEYKCAKK